MIVIDEMKLWFVYLCICVFVWLFRTWFVSLSESIDRAVNE